MSKEAPGREREKRPDDQVGNEVEEGRWVGGVCCRFKEGIISIFQEEEEREKNKRD